VGRRQALREAALEHQGIEDSGEERFASYGR